MITTFRVPRLASFAAIFLIAACGQTSNTTSLLATTQDPQTARITKSINTKFDRSGLNEIYFGSGQFALTTEARRRLDEVAGFIMEHPQARFNVIGHADAIGDDDYNRQLGMKRAQTAAAYLIGKGVSFMQLEATYSNGEEALAVQTQRQTVLNRRVVIEVFDMLKKPILYKSVNGVQVPVLPDEAVNSKKNVCSGGSLAGACGSASLLNVMNLDANAKVSRDLRISLELDGGVDASSPQTTADANVIGNVGNTVTSVTGSVGSSIGGLLGG